MITNNEPHSKKSQPEDGSYKDLNLTNSDATLQRVGNRQAPDAPTMNDGAVNVNNENLTQSAMQDGEVNPEFGDAADPAFETL